MGPIRTLSVLAALSLCTQMAGAADKDYNGRWDLTVKKTPADRAWWLEISGAGTPQIKGMCTCTPDGLEAIQNARIENGVLHFSYDKPAAPGRAGRGPIPAVHAEYEAKLVSGKLEGRADYAQKPWSFTGERAPEIKEHDDGSWVKGKPVELFNGKDLTGWTGITSGSPAGWRVEDGILTTDGKGENIATTQKFWNFELHAEFKVAEKNSNSGIGLRGRYEVQISNDYGKAEPGLHGMGALYHRIPPRVNASKPPGEWQAYDIRLVGRDVTTVLNGQTLYEKGVIDGLTGSLSFDPHEGQPGPIELQGDHATVYFRKITLTPLVRK
jgi:hypothetical protein